MRPLREMEVHISGAKRIDSQYSIDFSLSNPNLRSSRGNSFLLKNTAIDSRKISVSIYGKIHLNKFKKYKLSCITNLRE